MGRSTRQVFTILLGLFVCAVATAGRPYPRGGDGEDYLRFVLEVGRSVDSRTARALGAKYNQLRKADDAAADRFLKGLKFEIDQRAQLARGRIHSSSPATRAWVKRFLKAWYREADESLFRAYATKIARRNAEHLAKRAE